MDYQDSPSRNYSNYSSKLNNSTRSNREGIFYSQNLVVGKTQYIPFIYNDRIYHQTLNRCSDRQFKEVLRKILKDLNLLLYFRYEDFWMQLQTSQSLKMCLESCLLIFPNKSYGLHHQKGSKQLNNFKFSQVIKSYTFKLFSELMRVVLFIYYRMACDSRRQQKKIIYNQWLLDIPKMLNLINIYKKSNPKRVAEILNAVLIYIPQYIYDVEDFVIFTKSILLKKLNDDLSFVYTQQRIKNSIKNFSDPLLSFTRNLVKSFTRIYDLYNCLLDFVTYFPKSYLTLLICQPDLIIGLIEGYFKYIENITKRWEFTKQFIDNFKPVMEAIRQTIIDFISKILEVLNYILSTYASTQNWAKCLKVYYRICKQFVARNKVEKIQPWENLINILILQLIFEDDNSEVGSIKEKKEEKRLFRFREHFSHVLEPKQISVIRICQAYQTQYVDTVTCKSLKKEQFMQAKLINIPSYQQWREFENFKSFDYMDQLSFKDDLSIQQDSVLHTIQKQFNKEQIQKLRKQNMEPHLGLFNQKRMKKNKKSPYFNEEQYNDEPDEEIDELLNENKYLIGREANYDGQKSESEEEKINYDVKYYDFYILI